MPKQILTNDWAPLLGPEFHKDYYLRLREFLKHEYTEKTVYPDMYDLFNALKYTPYEKVKVVILGQDPYHEPGQAHGLSFSVKPGVPQPPSLQNIFKELHDDLGCPIPHHGCLIEWARQGVLLLNTVLSVRRGAANSHKGKGWEQFTDEVIRDLNRREKPIVFILWGRHAQAKKELITNPNHYIIESSHPSPLSARYSFFGSRPFSRANHYLQSVGEEPIDWQISVDEPSVTIH
ncbi:uracil-DNA glycosylase [Sporolactobacillus sp. THM7-4]|nr:uracil-DNA glycosylase [Sporolactobacillus sp. THM7-4]